MISPSLSPSSPSSGIAHDSFEAFGFDGRVSAGLAAVGYLAPTPIQSQAIPAILAGRDLLGLAQTGAGKTAAFVLPILQRLLGGDRCRARVLILSPTRELAEQTHVAICAISGDTGFRSMSMYGGVSVVSQAKVLRTRLPEIIVACPGRLLDLSGQGLVDLSAVEILVLDEADQMFDMGFLPSIRKIIALLPAKRQTLMFSATMPREIRSLAREYQSDPVRVEIANTKPVETVKHCAYRVEQGDKFDILLGILPGVEQGQTLVFTRTKHRAKKLAQQLTKSGIEATSLQGNLSQGQREKAMSSFRSGRVGVMVATDIAARGIDISLISHVVNFDIPDTVEAYTHRTGRTGRMLRSGTALSFVTPDDGPMVRSIEKLLGAPLEHRMVEGSVSPANRDPAPPRMPAEPRDAGYPAPRGPAASVPGMERRNAVQGFRKDRRTVKSVPSGSSGAADPRRGSGRARVAAVGTPGRSPRADAGRERFPGRYSGADRYERSGGSR